MGATGRPTAWTQELQDSIVADLEVGARFEDAAAANGIDERTIYRWIRRGESGEAPFNGFCRAVKCARARAKITALTNVRAGVLPSKEPGVQDWKAEAWFLERTFPAEYGPQQAVAVKVQKELDTVLDRLQGKLEPDVYDKVLAAIAAEDGQGEAPGEDGGEGGAAE